MGTILIDGAASMLAGALSTFLAIDQDAEAERVEILQVALRTAGESAGVWGHSEAYNGGQGQPSARGLRQEPYRSLWCADGVTLALWFGRFWVAWCLPGCGRCAVRRTSTATAPAPALSSSRSPLHLSYNPMIFRQDVLVEARALAVLILVVVVSVRVSQNREKTVHLRCWLELLTPRQTLLVPHLSPLILSPQAGMPVNGTRCWNRTTKPDQWHVAFVFVQLDELDLLLQANNFQLSWNSISGIGSSCERPSCYQRSGALPVTASDTHGLQVVVEERSWEMEGGSGRTGKKKQKVSFDQKVFW